MLHWTLPESAGTCRCVCLTTAPSALCLPGACRPNTAEDMGCSHCRTDRQGSSSRATKGGAACRQSGACSMACLYSSAARLLLFGTPCPTACIQPRLYKPSMLPASAASVNNLAASPALKCNEEPLLMARHKSGILVAFALTTRLPVALLHKLSNFLSQTPYEGHECSVSWPTLWCICGPKCRNLIGTQNFP